MLGQAQEFAARLEEMIRATVPGTPSIRAQENARTGRIRISPVDVADPLAQVRLPLYADGVELATWSFVMFAEGSADGFLKIDQLRMALTPAFEDAPLVRLEYEARSTSPPVSHWQFHAERGSLSFILARTHREGRRRDIPMSLSALHFATGGRRFRPGVEDFLQFLIQECRFDAHPPWKASLEDNRELARRFQVRTIARDCPAEVAEVLKERGWRVEPPDDFDEREATAVLREY